MQHGGKWYEATALYSRGGEQAPRPEQALAHAHLALIQQRAGVRWGCRMCTASTEGHCEIERERPYGTVVFEKWALRGALLAQPRPHLAGGGRVHGGHVPSDAAGGAPPTGHTSNHAIGVASEGFSHASATG